ncbi:MAG: cobalamin-dependent protein [Pyrinomonadaceae bacterium]
MTTKSRTIVSSVASDSHSWNLVFLQLWLEERGFEVRNLGNCVTADEIARACAASPPDVLVISSVNGHGAVEGFGVLEALKAVGRFASTRVVIGGKLSTSTEGLSELRRSLLEGGFDGVFVGPSAVAAFEGYLQVCGLLPSIEAELVAA